MTKVSAQKTAPQKKYTPKTLLVLETARNAFLRDGFEGTSMDMLAQESGVARRTIYNQFASKEKLFQAVVENIWFHLGVPSFPPEKRMAGDASENLFQLGLTIARHWAPPETLDFLRLIVREGDRFPHLAEDFYRMSKAPVIEHMKEYFTCLENEGVMAFGSKEIAVRQFVGLIMEPLRWLRLIGIGEEPGEDSYRLVVDEAVKTFTARFGLADAALSKTERGHTPQK